MLPSFCNRIWNAKETVLAEAILLLGSNLGARKQHLAEAVLQITQTAGKIVQLSQLYETSPWGTTSQNSYLNQALKIKTALLPENLLTELLKIEKSIGRTRSQRWEDRIIDIDILLYNQLIINSPTLTVPHPELPNRRFALEPVCEIAADWIHPISRLKIPQLLSACKDEGKVVLISKN